MLKVRLFQVKCKATEVDYLPFFWLQSQRNRGNQCDITADLAKLFIVPARRPEAGNFYFEPVTFQLTSSAGKKLEWSYCHSVDVAIRKHQRLDKILIFFFVPAHPGNQQSCLWENYVSVCCMKPIYNKHMLIPRNCITFCGHIAWKSFLVNNFADFPDIVRVKKQDFIQSWVAFHYSNICYCLGL